MGGRGEAGHVHADLGDDGLGASLGHPGDRQESGGGLSKRGHEPVDPGAEALDDRRELVDVVEVHAQHQGVVVLEVADHGLAQLGDLGAHPDQGHLGQHLGVSLAGDQRLQHPPARLAQHVGGHRVEVDAGVLQQRLDALGIPHPFLGQLGPG